MKHSLAFVALCALPAAAIAQTKGEFSLPDLPYAVDALEPVISAETMELHHGQHHQSYVDNLNAAISDGEAPAGLSLEELVANAGTYPETVRNNAGGHWNHSFFWETMAPVDETGDMSGELAAAIDSVYGSQESFRAAFEEAGVGQFGSGWVWLIVNEQNLLDITTTPNQDNPLMDVAETGGTPLLGNDLWEHAYYLDYRNQRDNYLETWWDDVNWDQVSQRYNAALVD